MNTFGSHFSIVHVSALPGVQSSWSPYVNTCSFFELSNESSTDTNYSFT